MEADVPVIEDGGRAYKVVWPDGGGFNPGYQIAKEPTTYPGMSADYRRTHHFHEMLRPDIFSAPMPSGSTTNRSASAPRPKA
jgi:hypothetical protein